MKFGFIYISIFITFLFCSDQGPGSQDPPGPVNMVQKWPGCDTLEYEPGIDPVPSSDDTLLQIMWYSHLEANGLSEFRIYRSLEPDGSRRYRQYGVVKVIHANAQDTIYVDSDVNLYQRYSYYVTAVNKDGIESIPSDTVWYELQDETTLYYPKDLDIINSVPIAFGWDYPGYDNPDKYIIRIERYWDINYHPLVYVKVVDAKYGEPNEVLVNDDRVKSDGIYRWRVDCIGPEELNSGSESSWELFELKLN